MDTIDKVCFERVREQLCEPNIVYLSRDVRKPDLIFAKTKRQISFAVTAKLIGASVFAIRKVQSLYFLNTKIQASSYLLCLYSLVCVGPGRKPRRPVFSQRCSFHVLGATSESRVKLVGVNEFPSAPHPHLVACY